jgi:hypothetical protein
MLSLAYNTSVVQSGSHIFSDHYFALFASPQCKVYSCFAERAVCCTYRLWPTFLSLHTFASALQLGYAPCSVRVMFSALLLPSEALLPLSPHHLCKHSPTCNAYLTPVELAATNAKPGCCPFGAPAPVVLAIWSTGGHFKNFKGTTPGN